MTIFVGKRPKTAPKPRSSAKARRSAARLAAVQVLYQMVQTGKSANEAVAEFVEFRIGHEVDGATFVAADITLLTAIVQGADAEQAHIDSLIEAAVRAAAGTRAAGTCCCASSWSPEHGSCCAIMRCRRPSCWPNMSVSPPAFYGGNRAGADEWGARPYRPHLARPYEFGVTGEGQIPRRGRAYPRRQKRRLSRPA